MGILNVLQEYAMNQFVEQKERSQVTFSPERLNEYVEENNPVRVVDVFVQRLQATICFPTRYANP